MRAKLSGSSDFQLRAMQKAFLLFHFESAAGKCHDRRFKPTSGLLPLKQEAANATVPLTPDCSAIDAGRRACLVMPLLPPAYIPASIYPHFTIQLKYISPLSYSDHHRAKSLKSYI